MEINEIVRNIFGSDVPLESPVTKPKKESSKHSRISINLNSVNQYIETTLGENAPIENVQDNRVGRLGPNVVKFDISTHQGLFIISPNRLSINSQSNFSTMKANVAVYKGKWMYELQLGSKGLMQIGWSTAKCEFNQQLGVGDTVNSYAYDGNRVRKWNVATHKYGEPWLPGDIIACAIDMDNGTIDFCRNGRNLGRAFENITTGAGFAYFPTVSLALTENLTANFGSTPMRYPIEGYEPLQAAPKQQIDQATLLFNWFLRITEVINARQNVNDENTLRDGNMSVQAYLMCLTRTVVKHIGPLVTVPYIAEYILVPFIQQLSESKTDPPLLLTCLDLFWTFLEEHEMKVCLESTVMYLLSAFRHVSLLLEYPDQCKSLHLLTKICQHSSTRQYLLQHLLFDRVRFANFMHVKPLDEGGLADVVKDVWWEMSPTDSTIEVNKASYLNACEKIKTAISEVETLQVELLVILLNNSDGNEKKPTSRAIFLRKLKRFVQENLDTSRTLPITLCCFHRLLVAFRVLWDAEVGTSPVYIPCRAFYDASIDHSRTERLGGVLSHLNKTFRNELQQLLGPEHEVITAMDQAQDSSNVHNRTRLMDLPIVNPTFSRVTGTDASGQGNSMIFERVGYFPYTREDRSPLRLGPLNPTTSLLELLDSIILFYHIVAKKQLAKVAILRNSMSEYITAMQDTKAKLEKAKKKKDPMFQSIQQELLRTINVFNTKLTEQARHMAWIRAAVYSKEKQSQIAWLLKVVALTLKNASLEENMFSFVPDFYLDALADLCVGLRNHMHPTASIEQVPNYREMFLDIAEFLCEHFMDPRIVNANSKSSLLLTLAGFVFNPLTLEILENVPEESRIKVVTNLLKSYDNRAWAESNWILVRFWQGNGFVFRYEKSPHLSKKVGPKLLQQESISQPIKPCPSAVYQNHVRDVLLKNPQATTKLLNSLLNQLNWAFSEFIGMVQEIHNVSSRPERVFIESRQLKICATCFDLAISLLRVLEMIATVAPSIFNNPSQFSNENLLSRLCQLLCQVLNRMSSQTSCFQHIVLLEIPDLESVDHFPILAAVAGILLALLNEDMANFKSKGLTEVPKVTQTLLMEPSFQMSSLYFMLGDSKVKTEKNIKPFSFANYPDDVTKEEIKKVKDMIEYLDKCRAILPDSKILSDDDSTCTICYAYPVAATFEPCHHQTCRICIDRHLLNTRECFFCKARIDKVVDLSGNVLHDFSNESALAKQSEELS
ncbi:E3 ubiquitin-protein ligase RNF123-like [Osmia bicornis bicornis]|uniref:E3 ubiquitin-protein ligase RNF123-like n=1 Tax=Osmia bicornis bicornis TaxID=1437191 RepID=UPI0010F89779|nr:E3 ubiquitin-protein ligase RNF123-like [Osmia bicornis bicornis]XP_029043574.1 E3 ubiquitin-protein ligase RNF123-like [Osmia bicornis bicornis]XP_029043575.1 E3 ubiquitin-protein ligase RNF123-like [Osmia bicornis bicornis]XP_029043577.1 E3 ubiquitin-protein ligase RNF123-like [Osmia bicornis bicornis]